MRRFDLSPARANLSLFLQRFFVRSMERTTKPAMQYVAIQQSHKSLKPTRIEQRAKSESQLASYKPSLSQIAHIYILGISFLEKVHFMTSKSLFCQGRN